jgi:U3 small nucleolar RNA-associated protein 15
VVQLQVSAILPGVRVEYGRGRFLQSLCTDHIDIKKVKDEAELNNETADILTHHVLIAHTLRPVSIMAAELQPIAQVKLTARPSSLTPEQTYWRTFKSPLNLKSPTGHGVTHVSQPSVSSSSPLPDTFAVTTGARVQVFSHRARKLVKTITRFDDTAHSGEIRYDGRVLVASDETGAIQVFDINSRAILKTWKEHKQPVWATKWSPYDSTSLMSCSDDATVRLWDLPSEHSVTIFRGHQDYVRSGCFMPGQGNNLLVSGSYDQTVKLWDPRVPTSAVMTFKHSAAVETVLCMPSGTTILAAAENQIAVLDVVAGRPLHMIKNHQKTVTSLALASKGERLVSGGLDGHMKVFETTGWNVVANSKYPSPILSLAVVESGPTREDKHVVVGMASGQLSIKTRLSGEEKVKERDRQKQMDALLAGTADEFERKLSKKRGRGWEKRFRGRDYAGDGADIIIESNDRPKTKKLKDWEKELHKGRYRQALDIGLEGKDRLTAFTILTTLRYRSALRASLEGRDDSTIGPVLQWVHHNISNPTFVPICVEVAMNLMDLYSKHLGLSTEMAKLVEKLHKRVREEVDRAQQACMTQGMLELLAPGVNG